MVHSNPFSPMGLQSQAVPCIFSVKYLFYISGASLHTYTTTALFRHTLTNQRLSQHMQS